MKKRILLLCMFALIVIDACTVPIPLSVPCGFAGVFTQNEGDTEPEPIGNLGPRDVAEFNVLFVVNKDGSVNEARIIGKWIRERKATCTEVELIDEPYEKSIIQAAMQWKFKPATREGEPIQGLASASFKYGI